MSKITVTTALLAVLLVPSGAMAAPKDPQKRAAVAQCKDERGKSRATREAFKAKYHSFNRCVSQNAAEEEAEQTTAHKNAAKECKAEREADPAAFEQTYGSDGNASNAYGKCVSTKAKERKAEMDAEDEQEVEAFKNAAKECAAQRKAMGSEAFAESYGNKRNAFAKCVSGRTQEPRS